MVSTLFWVQSELIVLVQLGVEFTGMSRVCAFSMGVVQVFQAEYNQVIDVARCPIPYLRWASQPGSRQA